MTMSPGTPAFPTVIVVGTVPGLARSARPWTPLAIGHPASEVYSEYAAPLQATIWPGRYVTTPGGPRPDGTSSDTTGAAALPSESVTFVESATPAPAADASNAGFAAASIQAAHPPAPVGVYRTRSPGSNV